MKTYYVCAAVVFLLAYAVFHFGFRAGGEGQLYRINDRIAFELHTPNEFFNGVTIRSYRPTNGFVRFVCGACEFDKNGAVEMVNVNYRQGDWVFTNFPQHDKIPTDIINLRTGETIEAKVPQDFKFGDDFSQLPEYKSLNLVRSEENRLTQDYVKANFKKLSTFTNRCLYAHIIFAVAFLLLAFPNFFINLLAAFFDSSDPTDPSNYYRNDFGS